MDTLDTGPLASSGQEPATTRPKKYGIVARPLAIEGKYYRNEKTGTLRSAQRDVRRSYGKISGRQWVRARKRARRGDVMTIAWRVMRKHRRALQALANS